MAAGGDLDLRPITTADVVGVAEFLHAELNTRLPATSWAAAIVPSWSVGAPNHGFLLQAGDRIVGAQLALYSQRLIMGRAERVCNLASRCVMPAFRRHGERLFRSTVAQPGFSFTDLTPGRGSADAHERLGFCAFDTRSVLLPNLPRPARRSITVTGDQQTLLGTLTGDDLRRCRDHLDCLAARQLVIRAGAEHCHVIYRRDRRKGITAFASLLYASNPSLLRRALPEVRSYLIRHDRLVATLAEIRLVGRPAGAVDLPETRLKLYRSDRLTGDHLDYLYSELTCVPW